MAEEVDFSEILCFIRNNFDKLTVSQIKPVLRSFYDDEDLSTAKETLQKGVVQAAQRVGDTIPLPRLPKRQGEGKASKMPIIIILLIIIIIIIICQVANKWIKKKNNNNNKHDNVYGAVIMAEPLREFTRFI